MPYYGLTETELQNTTQSLPLPVGSVVGFLSTSLPTGFIICDGRTIQSTAPLDPDYYPQLVEHLDPGQTTATVPDLRGTFLRGYSIDSSVDPDGPRSPGDTQTDANKAHTHNVDWKYNSNLAGGGTGAGADGGGGTTYVIETTDETPAGATEARPKNTAVVWGIKASDTIINSTVYNETDPNSLFMNITRSLKDQFNARLSTSSTNPVEATNDVATLYLTRFRGDSIWLYNISKFVWERWELPATSVTSISLAGSTDNLPYDIFVYDNLGTLTLERVAWTNETTRATALTTQDGVYVKTGEVNKRFVGTYVAKDGLTRFEDGFTGGTGTQTMVWGLSNHYNRIHHVLQRSLSPTANAFPGGSDIILKNDSSTFIGVASTSLTEQSLTYRYNYTYRATSPVTINTSLRVSTTTAVTTGSPALSLVNMQHLSAGIGAEGTVSDGASVKDTHSGVITFGLTGSGFVDILGLRMLLEVWY